MPNSSPENIHLKVFGKGKDLQVKSGNNFKSEGVDLDS